VTVDSITIVSSGANRAGIRRVNVTLEVNNCRFTTTSQAQPWWVDNSNITIRNSFFQTNAPGMGWTGANVKIFNSTFSNCNNAMTPSGGGSLYFGYAGEVLITNSTFINSTAGLGGPLFSGCPETKKTAKNFGRKC
jgi:hypothetical protein